MLTTERDNQLDQVRMIIQANRSMSWTDNMVLIVVLGVFGVSIATGFALVGLWMVFPFVGLEILALTLAMYFCWLRLQRTEVITVTADRVTLESGVRGPELTVSAEREQTRIDYKAPANECSVGVLKLNMQGQMHRIGANLGREEVGALAQQLQKLLHSAPSSSFCGAPIASMK